MAKVLVAPDFELDEDMFGVARQALKTHAHQWASRLTEERFFARESWRLIPNPEEPELPFFKAELVLLNQPPWTRTIKINVWEAPDVRRKGKATPHNHPWRSFTSHILMGGYREVRYSLRELKGKPHVDIQTFLYRAGTPNNMNVLPLEVYHEVVEVYGRTLTLMDCGPGIKDSWGYLDPETGLYTPHREAPIHPAFKELLYDRNPHLRP